jgi:hypothetical protein
MKNVADISFFDVIRIVVIQKEIEQREEEKKTSRRERGRKSFSLVERQRFGEVWFCFLLPEIPQFEENFMWQS